MANSSFEDFCGGTLWNNTLTWDTPQGDPPDLTRCFQETVLIWIPCGFLWLALPLYLYNLCAASSIFPTPINRLHVSKIVIVVLLVGLSLCDVIKYVVESQGSQAPFLAQLVSPLILSATLIVSLILMILERRKGFITSGLIFVFYFLLLVVETFKFASLILELRSESDNDIFRAVTFFASYFLTLLLVLLLCFAETRPDLEEDHRTCPEVKGSFLSRMTFWWVTSLILRGYRSALTEEDVFKLNPRDKVEATLPEFSNSWNRELKACNWTKRAEAGSQPKKKKVPTATLR